MEGLNISCPVCLDDQGYVGCYACSELDEDEEFLSLGEDDSIPTQDIGHTYYGKLSDKQPTLGVIYSMLDEHVKKIVDKRADAFINVLNATLKKFKKSTKDELTIMKKSLSYFKTEVNKLQKNNAKLEKDLKDLRNGGVISLGAAPRKMTEDKEMEEVRKSLTKKGIIKGKYK